MKKKKLDKDLVKKNNENYISKSLMKIQRNSRTKYE